MNHEKSNALWARAERVLAGGPATLSKHPSRYPWGIAPKFLKGGCGAEVWDVDGHTYIDMVAALGPIILGHNNEYIYNAVMRQIGSGEYGLISSTLPTSLEVEVAEMLCDMIPGAEQVRFASNGADVTNAAIKIARYVTGKSDVIFTGYHGGHDSYLSTTDKDGGVVGSTSLWNHQIPWGEFSFSEPIQERPISLLSDLAAIVVEVPPVAQNVSIADVANILGRYKQIAHDAGALFIMDEVVTGFRYHLSGAQHDYGVTADLACFSKGMANGYPCAAITGPREYMKAFEGGKVFLSTTFGANAVGLAACKMTLEMLYGTPALENLHAHGETIREHFVNMMAEYKIPATLRGNAARMVIDWHFDQCADRDELQTLWLQETIKRGVLFGVPIFPMTCYDDSITQKVLQAANESFSVIAEVTDGKKRINDALECPVIRTVFDRYKDQENH